ncbi:MAG: hypothetical protein JWP32_93 [Schumannella sp.]|nr:hypothetical protein [Schumannella sp.]
MGARVTRLPGSGAVPRAFACAVLVVGTVFLGVWVSAASSGLVPAIVLEAILVAAVIRSLFVGVLLDGDAVLVRGWFRDYRYAPGELKAVVAIPYWRFLDAKDPILSLLKFTPASGWVREISATVSWKDRTLAQAVAVRRHLGVEELS